MKLFRQEAIESKRRRLWGEVRLAQPPSLMIWTAVLIVICGAVFAILALGRYTRSETVPGFLYAETGVVDVRPVQGGRVSRVFVREGQAVAVGDPLIEFSSDVESLESGLTLNLQLSEVDRQVTSLRQRGEAIAQSYATELGRLEDQIAAQEDLVAILQRQRDGQVDAVALAESDLERFARLQVQGFAPAVEVDRRRRAVLDEQGGLRALDGQIAAANARVSDLRSQTVSLPSRQTEVEAVLRSENARLSQQRAELALAQGYVLRAPIAGTVTRLLARDGFTPPNNGRLLTIAPENAMLYARLLVPTRAIGFLEAGQTANLKIDAFPFERFGMVEGYVSEIHPLVVQPSELNYPIPLTEPVYEVDVFIRREYINAFGERRNLRPGMVLRADLPIDRRWLWQQLFDPLLAAGSRFAGQDPGSGKP